MVNNGSLHTEFRKSVEQSLCVRSITIQTNDKTETALVYFFKATSSDIVLCYLWFA